MRFSESRIKCLFDQARVTVGVTTHAAVMISSHSTSLLARGLLGDLRTGTTTRHAAAQRASTSIRRGNHPAVCRVLSCVASKKSRSCRIVLYVPSTPSALSPRPSLSFGVRPGSTVRTPCLFASTSFMIPSLIPPRRAHITLLCCRD